MTTKREVKSAAKKATKAVNRRIKDLEYQLRVEQKNLKQIEGILNKLPESSKDDREDLAMDLSDIEEGDIERSF